ncbi:MAG: glycosyltransferase [Lachnospiraceae bacterium]|nr:glycosyltransferase [Lachnospiraceae bacterium]
MSIYNKTTEKELSQSIDSMLNQTLKASQFIIVCDGSISEEIEGILLEFVERFPELFWIIKLEQNVGLAAALNEGIKVAKYELIARMDSDDISLPDRCRQQVQLFWENPELALVGTAARDFNGDVNQVSGKIRLKPESHEEIIKEMRRNNPFIHSTVMFKKSVVLECGGYDNSLRRRQDYDLFSKIVSRGYRAANIREPLLLFRVDDNFIDRNRNRETCDARLTVQKRIWRRGECSIGDYLYVFLAMKISPMVSSGLYKRIYSLIKNSKG